MEPSPTDRDEGLESGGHWGALLVWLVVMAVILVLIPWNPEWFR